MIYESRPEVCRTYFCVWANLPGAKKRHRPNVSGVFAELLQAHIDGRMVKFFSLKEVWPGAFKKPRHRDVVALLMAGRIPIVKTLYGEKTGTVSDERFVVEYGSGSNSGRRARREKTKVVRRVQ